VFIVAFSDDVLTARAFARRGEQISANRELLALGTGWFSGTGAVQPRWESPAHRRYEALRAYLAEGLPAAEAAARFGQQHQVGLRAGSGGAQLGQEAAVVETPRRLAGSAPAGRPVPCERSPPDTPSGVAGPGLTALAGLMS